jgi:hypothetical protein
LSKCNIIPVRDFDDYVRLLAGPKWTVLSEFLHATSAHDHPVCIFCEKNNQFAPLDPHVDLPDAGETGITHITCGIGNRLLASVSARTAIAVYLWNTEAVSLAVVVVCRSDVVQID